MFCIISGAHSGLSSRIWSEFGPDRAWDPSRISKSYSWGLLYAFAAFPDPVLARFSTKFAGSENSLPQGAFLKSLPEAS